MYCTKCGKQLNTEDRFCPNCGTRKPDLFETNQIREPEQQYYYSQPSYQNQSTHETSNAALICGIVSIFFAGLIFGIIALVLANRPEAKNKKVAKITGTIGIIGWAFAMIILYI